MLSYGFPGAMTHVDDTVIESICEQSYCARTASTAHVCVRDSDGTMIYAGSDRQTSTMPGHYQTNDETAAVLTPIP